MRTMKADIIVIGGGVIGTSVGYFLSKAGKRVIVVEKDDLAHGASGACDQDIILQSKSPGIHLQMAQASAQMYETLSEELNFDIEYKKHGGMVLIETPTELEVMKELVKKQKETGLEVEIISKDEAKRLQRGLAEHLMGSTYCKEDAHVNSLKLVQGFIKNIRALGGEVLFHTGVTGIKLQGDRVQGVETTQGLIEGEVVVNATGAWAPLIAQMVGQEIPIKPRRGQIIVTEAVPHFVNGDIISARYIAAKYNPKILENSDDLATKLGVGLSLSQTKKGNILIGATREFVDYDRNTTREGIKEILKNAVRLVPGLKDVNVIRVFSGLRPYTPDGLPVLGDLEGVKGFVMAAGHEGDGIALAPITGKLIAQHICGEKTDFDLKLFSSTRFKM